MFTFNRTVCHLEVHILDILFSESDLMTAFNVSVCSFTVSKLQIVFCQMRLGVVTVVSILQVTVMDETWTVFRRYSRFREMHKSLKSKYPEVSCSDSWCRGFIL